MKKHWKKRLICCAAAASFLYVQASAYDFREEKMDGDLTAVQGYLEEMLRAGGTQAFALGFEKAVRIPYVEMEAWKTFLTAAAQGEWTEIPAEQANWMIPAAREGGRENHCHGDGAAGCGDGRVWVQYPYNGIAAVRFCF